jgi:opacity protein-like surface antigen
VEGSALLKFSRLSTFLVAISLTILAGHIQARADGKGFYLSAALGAYLVSDDDTGRSDVIDTSFVPGYGLIAALGYELPRAPVRFEGEIAYRKSDLDDINSIIGTISASGSMAALSLMANAYVFRPSTILEPYVGAGIGYARVTTDDIQVAGIGVVGGKDWSPAYQGIIGVEFDALPLAIDLGLEYRYFSAGEIFLSLNPGGSFDLDYDSHNILARIRYSF